MIQQVGAQRQYFGSNNPSGYQNPEVVRLTDQLVATADAEELDRIYDGLTEILRADLPFTRLVPFTTTIFAHRRVRGPIALLQPGEGDNIEDLWLEDGPELEASLGEL